MSQFYCNTCDRLRNVRFHGYEEVKGEPICESCYTEVRYREVEDVLTKVYPKPHGEPGEGGADE